jgi:hypothetical protein
MAEEFRPGSIGRSRCACACRSSRLTSSPLSFRASVWQKPQTSPFQNRFYIVNPAQDGSGYFVTRYDVDGTFTTVPGAHHPGDCANTFDSADTGTFNGVWTRKVSGSFDYNPDAALPASGSWDDFISKVFAGNGESPTVTDISYEFDYYNTCGDHWRDAAYPYPTIVDSGSIGNCPR